MSISPKNVTPQYSNEEIEIISQTVEEFINDKHTKVEFTVTFNELIENYLTHENVINQLNEDEISSLSIGEFIDVSELTDDYSLEVYDEEEDTFSYYVTHTDILCYKTYRTIEQIAYLFKHQTEQQIEDRIREIPDIMSYFSSNDIFSLSNKDVIGVTDEETLKDIIEDVLIFNKLKHVS